MKHFPPNLRPVVFFGSAMLCLASCATLQEPLEPVPGPGGGSIVAIKVGAISFAPRTIMARRGDRLALDVENVSRKGHNLTIEHPGGGTVKSVDLPPGKTVRVEILLEDPGTYRFFCDRPLHGPLGMTGLIQAKP